MKFYINNNGEIMNTSFDSFEEAQAEIASYEDEDAYLMKVVKLNDWEADLINAISEMNIDSEHKQELLKTVNESENKKFISKQIINSVGTGFFEEEYTEHLLVAICHGGFATDEDFHEVKLKSYKDFLVKKSMQLKELIDSL